MIGETTMLRILLIKLKARWVYIKFCILNPRLAWKWFNLKNKEK
jgi:hypothetical protein